MPKAHATAAKESGLREALTNRERKGAGEKDGIEVSSWREVLGNGHGAARLTKRPACCLGQGIEPTTRARTRGVDHLLEVDPRLCGLF